MSALGIAGALVVLIAGAATGQTPSPEQTPGVWRAVEAELTNYPRLTREERREVLEQFTAVVNVLKGAAALNPPIGIELTPSISNIGLYSRFVVADSQPLPAMMWIRINKYTASHCPTCPVEPHSLWDGAFNVLANTVDPLYGNWRNPAWKLEDDWYYVEPKMLREAHGVRHYEHGYAVVTARTEPLFAAVTQERFLRARVAEAQRELARVEAIKQQGTPYEQHARGRDERARNWKKVLEGARRYQPPEKIAEMQAQHDTMERELEAQLRRSEAADRARVEQAVSTVRGQLQELESERAALGVEGRAAPALSCGTVRRSGLCAKPDGPEVRRLVVANPRLFDASRPRTKFQLLLLQRRSATPGNRAATRALTETWDTLDWSQLLAIVR